MNTLPVSRKFYYGALTGIGLFLSPIILAMQHPEYMNKKLRPETTIIITGATGKLGHATTRELSKRNCRIIMACRNMDLCKAIRREMVLVLRNKSIVCRHIDLEDIDSINKFADNIIEQEPHVDVLINMAAVKDLEQKEMTKYGIEKHFFVNFLAPYLLTLKLMPKLEESAKTTKDSRVINVIGNPKKSWHIDLNDINFDNRKYNGKDAYNQSKLALAYFTILLEKFNRAKNNHVYVFGTSPSVKNINPMNDFSTGLASGLKGIKREWTGYTPLLVCQRNIYCALEKDLVKEPVGSGKNYNYGEGAWGWNSGWGVAAANENKAKLTWNVAAALLLNAKPIANTSDNKTPPTGDEVKLAATGQAPGDQVKAQGNNKASGVLESA